MAWRISINVNLQAEKTHSVQYYLKPKCLNIVIASVLGGIGHVD